MLQSHINEPPLHQGLSNGTKQMHNEEHHNVSCAIKHIYNNNFERGNDALLYSLSLKSKLQ
jgi:hypothetical protein